jgi:hypothetical protein
MMREAQIIDGMIDLLVETIHKIGVRSKRKVVAGIVRDIEKVYGKERLLVDIAGAAIEAPVAGLRCDLSDSVQGKACGDRQGASGEGHARTAHYAWILCRSLSKNPAEASFGSGVSFEQCRASARAWGVGLDQAGLRNRMPSCAAERGADRRGHSAEMAQRDHRKGRAHQPDQL